jgi:hypothetical protein
MKMKKNSTTILITVIFITFCFFAANSGKTQDIPSFGPAPVSDIKYQHGISNDNISGAATRGFVHISATNSHQLNKQLMGNVSLTPIGSPFTTAGWLGASTRNTSNGLLYINNQASPFQIWTRDTATGTSAIVCSCTDLPQSNFTGMVWDHTTNTMYGVSSSLTVSSIFTINLTTGVCTPIGSPSVVISGAISLACAPNGTLFSHCIVTDKLYKWNKITGVPTEVGALGFAANYGQDASFDLSDGILYLATAGPGNILRICDTTTGSATTIIGTYTGQPSCLTVWGNIGVYAAPNLISPMNNSIGLSLTPTLVWSTVFGATGYKIKISTDSTFTNVTDSATVTNNQYTIPSGKLNYNTKYYWKAAGYNSYVVGPYSTMWNFTTINPFPLQVNLFSPANNSIDVNLTPTLFWFTATGATQYKVLVSPMITFGFIIDSAIVTTNQRQIPAGKLNYNSTYYWKVCGINSFGSGPWSDVWNFSTILSGINQIGNEIPKEYKLYNNYPNPFNPVTRIRYDLPKGGIIKFVIYDLLGREIETLINEKHSAGTFEILFDASNYTSGIYYYRLTTDEFSDTRKMTLLK